MQFNRLSIADVRAQETCWHVTHVCSLLSQEGPSHKTQASAQGSIARLEDALALGANAQAVGFQQCQVSLSIQCTDVCARGCIKGLGCLGPEEPLQADILPGARQAEGVVDWCESPALHGRRIQSAKARLHVPGRQAGRLQAEEV